MADTYSDSVDPTDTATTFEGAEDGERRQVEMFESSDKGSKTFDDDAGKTRTATTNQTRAQARANAHHIQKFVNQQGACWVDLPLLGAQHTSELYGVLSQCSARRR